MPYIRWKNLAWLPFRARLLISLFLTGCSPASNIFPRARTYWVCTPVFRNVAGVEHIANLRWVSTPRQFRFCFSQFRYQRVPIPESSLGEGHTNITFSPRIFRRPPFDLGLHEFVTWFVRKHSDSTSRKPWRRDPREKLTKFIIFLLVARDRYNALGGGDFEV